MNCQTCRKFLGDIEPVEMDDPIHRYIHFCSPTCLMNWVSQGVLVCNEEEKK